MSWLPSNDPLRADAQSYDALELVVVPRVRDLGGFEVRRALPHAQRQMVGPFIFFDHLGPVQFAAGQGMDVRPHPHIGLATVTYLLAGRILHRDSEGNVQEISPGAMNLMTAGRGIVHSERTPPTARTAGQWVQGLQSWIALPLREEEVAPSLPPIVRAEGLSKTYRAHGLEVPALVDVTLRVERGEMVAVMGPSVPLDSDYEERAIYLLDGEIQIAADRFEGPQLLIFRPGDRIGVRALQPSHMMLLGGTAMEGPRHIWWNFVSSSKERIEKAKTDWKENRFAKVPGDPEFIPLPDK